MEVRHFEHKYGIHPLHTVDAANSKAGLRAPYGAHTHETSTRPETQTITSWPAVYIGHDVILWTAC